MDRAGYPILSYPILSILTDRGAVLIPEREYPTATPVRVQRGAPPS